MQLVLVGLNHHSAPISVRERLNCAEQALPEALAAAVACSGVREAVVLSTCNRMEVYAVVETDSVKAAHDTLCQYLSSFHNVPESAFLSHLFRYAEQEAATHLMRVAAGLDSLVLGEAQILGQVRAAFQTAQEAGTCGPTLAALFQQALASGKRVRHETALGRGAFSIGRAAVDLAHSIFSDLSHAGVLILGAGKMSELTAKHLVSNGVRFVVVANRTYEKAVSMAAKLGGKAIHYDTFPDALVTADIVISSTAAPHPIIHRETLAPVLRKRRGKPLFLIDIAVPRDIDANVNGLDNVFLYNIDDLEAVVAEEARGREQEAEKADAIASEEATKFLAWVRTREAVPVIAQLQERLARIREEELALLRSQLGSLSEREWKHIEAATRAMMNKVAREPILRLKRETTDSIEETAGVQYDLMTAAREIFGLSQTTEMPPAQDADVVEEAAAVTLPEPTVSPASQPGVPCDTVEARS